MKKNLTVSICTFVVTILLVVIVYYCIPSKIVLGNHGTAYLKNNQIIRDVDIDNSKNPLKFVNTYKVENEDMTVEVSDISFEIERIGLKFSDLDALKSIDIPVLNTKSNDIRIVNFNVDGSVLTGKYKKK